LEQMNMFNLLMLANTRP